MCVEKIKQSLRNLHQEYKNHNEEIDKKLQSNEKISERNHTILVHSYNKNLDFMKELEKIILEN